MVKLDPYGEQTEAKHKYFKDYFFKWVTIIGNSNYCKNLIYVDSFSNAGKYQDGSVGSPIIALDCINSYIKKNECTNRFYVFLNDYDQERIDYLKNIVQSRHYSKNIVVDFKCMEANDHIEFVLKRIKIIHSKKSFFFIDPYKVADNVIEIDKLVEILHDDNYSELIFNHMVFDTVRNIKTFPEKYLPFYKGVEEKSIDSLTGDKYNQIVIEYITANSCTAKNKKIYFASYPFLNSRNRELYYLLIFTKHPVGFNKIKESLWYVSDGILEHKNSVQSKDQLSLFDTCGEIVTKCVNDYTINVKLEHLRELILEEFTGKTVFIEDLIKFVEEETIFHTGQLKTKTLRPLEQEGKIKYINGVRKKNYTYPAKTELKFI